MPLGNISHQQHVRTGFIELKPISYILVEHRGCKGTERLAVLNLEVKPLLHVGSARIAEDGAGSERPRAKFHPSLKPTDRLLVYKGIDGCFEETVVVHCLVPRTSGTQAALYLALAKFRAEKAPRHAVEAIVWPARPMQIEMIGCECRSHGPASIARRRLDPQPVDLPRAPYLSICHTIQCHSPSKTQRPRAKASESVVHQPSDNFFGHHL